MKSAPYKDLRFLTGAGSVYATAKDLWHFVQAIDAKAFGGSFRDDTFGNSAEWVGWTGRTNGYEASVDVLPKDKLVFVFLSNLQSAANWQLREQVKQMLLGQAPSAIPLPPPVGVALEAPGTLLGQYGPAAISQRDGALFRGDNEFYPVEGGRYYIPASGTTMRFRRDPAGKVDAIISVSGGGSERVLARTPEQ